ncbi:MAG: tetratricopeptide repeat protein [Nitrospinae bacterium]|nr:tetratricopeptide repeat protein [Nitrospinota bacterium]MBL7019795.1 tetratricopeptide repeat protein [Nitrospinaceae bacterium]
MNVKSTDVIGHQIKPLIVLTCMGLLAFWATLQSPFLYDDAHAIIENPYIQQLDGFQKNVGIGNIFNRSVLLLTFAVNREIGELEVFGYHLVNILVHILTGLVWYFLVSELLLLEPNRQWLKRLPLICAAIHLLNPLTVETVTYISSRSSGLATFFYLLAFYIFCRLVRPRKKDLSSTGKLLFIIGILGVFFLGVGTKEIVVTFPLMAIIYIWLITPREKRKFFSAKIGVLLLPLLLYFCYRYMEQGDIFSLKADPVYGETSRYWYFLSQIQVAVNYYLLKLFLPFNLNFEPDIRLLPELMGWQFIFAFGVLGLGTTIVYRHKSSLFKFAILWLVITLLPTSSIIPLKQIVTEHRIYLPGLGFSLALGWLFLNVPRVFATGLLLIFLSLNFLITVNRSLDYRSEVSLWEDTAEKSPNKALVHNNLATAYMEAKMLTEAERELAVTLQLNPAQSDAYANLGHIHFQRENWKQAIEEFDLAIALGSGKSDTYYFSGLAWSKQWAYAEAIPFLQRAVSMRPHKAHYHFDLGNAYQNLRIFDEALREFRQTLEIQPKHPQAQNNIGVIFWNLEAYEKAEVEFKKALNIQHDVPEIHHNLAALYLKIDQHADAIPHLKEVLKLQPENATAKKLLDYALSRVKEGPA